MPFPITLPGCIFSLEAFLSVNPLITSAPMHNLGYHYIAADNHIVISFGME